MPAIYDPSQIDVQHMASSEEAIEMARQPDARERIFAGMSSDTAMLAAAQSARKLSCDNTVAVLPDRAEKYLSTVMFEPFAHKQ